MTGHIASGCAKLMLVTVVIHWVNNHVGDSRGRWSLSHYCLWGNCANKKQHSARLWGSLLQLPLLFNFWVTDLPPEEPFTIRAGQFHTWNRLMGKAEEDEAWSRTQDSLTRSVNAKTAPSQANWAKERCYQYPIENQCKTMALGISFMTWNISDACFAPDWAPRISWTHWLETYTYRYCSLCELYGDLVWAHPLQVLQLLSASNLPPSTGYFHKTHVNFVAFEGSSSLSEWSNGLAEE